MTPYELTMHIDSFNERLKADQQNLIVQAYLTAAWQRAKRMPNLKKLLGEERPTKHQTPQQMLDEVKKLNAAFGGTTY